MIQELKPADSCGQDAYREVVAKVNEVVRWANTTQLWFDMLAHLSEAAVKASVPSAMARREPVNATDEKGDPLVVAALFNNYSHEEIQDKSKHAVPLSKAVEEVSQMMKDSHIFGTHHFRFDVGSGWSKPIHTLADLEQWANSVRPVGPVDEGERDADRDLRNDAARGPA